MPTKTAIEPVIPVQKLRPLEDLACTIVERSVRLSAKLREPLRVQIAELTRWMHCYYSNPIEGQQTRVRDIEAALKKRGLRANATVWPRIEVMEAMCRGVGITKAEFAERLDGGRTAIGK